MPVLETEAELGDRPPVRSTIVGRSALEMLPASGPTQEAWSTFYQLAKERRLAHDGDSALSAHVEAAAVFPTEREPRIRRLKITSCIDALSATVLAVARCEAHQHETQPMSPNIYWMTIDGEDFRSLNLPEHEGPNHWLLKIAPEPGTCHGGGTAPHRLDSRLIHKGSGTGWRPCASCGGPLPGWYKDAREAE